MTLKSIKEAVIRSAKATQKAMEETAKDWADWPELPPMPERFTNGGATAEERDAWLATHVKE